MPLSDGLENTNAQTTSDANASFIETINSGNADI